MDSSPLHPQNIQNPPQTKTTTTAPTQPSGTQEQPFSIRPEIEYRNAAVKYTGARLRELWAYPRTDHPISLRVAAGALFFSKAFIHLAPSAPNSHTPRVMHMEQFLKPGKPLGYVSSPRYIRDGLWFVEPWLRELPRRIAERDPEHVHYIFFRFVDYVVGTASVAKSSVGLNFVRRASFEDFYDKAVARKNVREGIFTYTDVMCSVLSYLLMSDPLCTETHECIHEFRNQLQAGEPSTYMAPRPELTAQLKELMIQLLYLQANKRTIDFRRHSDFDTAAISQEAYHFNYALQLCAFSLHKAQDSWRYTQQILTDESDQPDQPVGPWRIYGRIIADLATRCDATGITRIPEMFRITNHVLTDISNATACMAMGAALLTTYKAVTHITTSRQLDHLKRQLSAKLECDFLPLMKAPGWDGWASWAERVPSLTDEIMGLFLSDPTRRPDALPDRVSSPNQARTEPSKAEEASYRRLAMLETEVRKILTMGRKPCEQSRYTETVFEHPTVRRILSKIRDYIAIRVPGASDEAQLRHLNETEADELARTGLGEDAGNLRGSMKLICRLVHFDRESHGRWWVEVSMRPECRADNYCGMCGVLGMFWPERLDDDDDYHYGDYDGNCETDSETDCDGACETDGDDGRDGDYETDYETDYSDEDMESEDEDDEDEENKDNADEMEEGEIIM